MFKSKGNLKKFWRPTLALTVSAVLVGSLAACSSSNDNKSTDDAVLRIGTTGTIESLNPFVTEDTLSFDFYQAIYPHLLQYDLKTHELAPDFATSWKAGDSGRELTFNLVKDATWSDGEPLNAEDVAWTLSLMMKFQEGPTSAWAGSVTHMTKATAVDDTTLKITYDKPISDALALITHIPVLPEQSWAKYAAGNGKKLSTVANTPSADNPMVSGGPFTFVKYVNRQSALFKKNPKYWGDKPHIAGFGVQFFGTDDAEIAALKSSQIDLAMGNPSLPATDAAPLKKGNFRILTQPSVSFNELAINTNPEKTNNRELLNPKVREAMEYATDREQINKLVLLGFGEPGASIVPPATGDWHDDSIKPLPFDLAKANALLDEAGYKMGPGGIRIADGHPMAYTLLISPDNVGGLRTGQLMSQTYAKAGIKLKLKQVDDDTLETEITKNKYRDYDLMMWGWDTLIDPSYILGAMTCAEFDNNNDSGYCDADYDKMFAEQGTLTDPAARQALVHKMQAKVYNDRPYIVLYYLDVLEGWSRDWAPVTEGPTGFLSQFSSRSLIDVHKVN